MFDKLIESDTAGAEFKNRSRYFTVSTIIVGILFLTAVVYSLYAAEVGLGSMNFDVSELVSPLDTNEPETPEPRRSVPDSGQRSASRPNSDMARVDEPTITPTAVSTNRNSQQARSWEPFNPKLPEGIGSGPGSGNGPGVGTVGTSSNENTDRDSDEPKDRTTEPPPVITKKAPTIIRTSKMLNGSALSLPKPAYPKPAVMLNLEGSVNVQVTIDEKGNVVSAKAADGHPFFRSVAEQAARGAKFKPTILNDVPIKVTGIIVYRFKRS